MEQQQFTPLKKFPSREIRLEARERYRAAKPHPALVTLAVMAILIVLYVLSMGVDGSLREYADIMTVLRDEGYDAAMTAVQTLAAEGTEISIGAWLLGIVISCMSLVISTGYTLYLLRTARGTKAGLGDVFDAFGVFLRAVVLNILRSFLIGLWMMIYVLPVSYCLAAYPEVPLMAVYLLPLMFFPLRASYAYSQAEFIMLDNRHLSCMQCLMISRAVMTGRKWERFKLDLTFLGWWALCLIPFAALWVRPYYGVAAACYYRKALNDYRDRKDLEHPGQHIHLSDEEDAVQGEGGSDDNNTTPPDDNNNTGL